MRVFIIILTTLIVNDIEKLLGRNILDFPDAIETNREIESNLKSYGLDKTVNFHGHHINYLNLETNSDNVIMSIGFVVQGKLDEATFKAIKGKYGKPKTMLKIGNTISENAINQFDYRALLTKSFAIPCSFEEEPAFVVWKKEDVEVLCQKHPDNSHTLIKFTLLR
ncbi:hypothetical protein [Flagellimonas marinaquae]